MSRLDDLIAQYCPDGVEYTKISLITDYEQPGEYIVNSTDYNDQFDIPVLTAGQTFILGYTNEKQGIFYASPDKPVIIFDDFTGGFKWVDFPFKVKSSAMKMITTKKDIILMRYFFHVMGWLNFTSAEHKRLWIGTYSEFKVPVPPLPVQQEIVRILDSFTQLTTELKTKLQEELQARKEQYSFYRKAILSNQSVQQLSLEEIATPFRGEYITKNRSTPGNIPVILGGQEPAYYIDKSNHNGEIVVIARSGVSAGFVSYWNEPIYITDGFGYEAKENIVIPKYLYYVLKNIEPTLNSMKRGAGVPHVSGEALGKVILPIPPINVQTELISFFEEFHKLFDSLASNLQTEIEKSHKQYEYYRDKLLTFPEKK